MTWKIIEAGPKPVLARALICHCVCLAQTNRQRGAVELFETFNTHGRGSNHILHINVCSSHIGAFKPCLFFHGETLDRWGKRRVLRTTNLPSQYPLKRPASPIIPSSRLDDSPSASAVPPFPSNAAFVTGPARTPDRRAVEATCPYTTTASTLLLEPT